MVPAARAVSAPGDGSLFFSVKQPTKEGCVLIIRGEGKRMRRYSSNNAITDFAIISAEYVAYIVNFWHDRHRLLI